SDNHLLKLARDSANQAVSANSDLAAGHSILSEVLLQAGERASAKSEAERAMQLNPLASAPYLALAKLDSKSDFQNAERLFRKAAELAPDDWITHGDFGVVLYRAARYEQASQEWEKAIRIA